MISFSRYASGQNITCLYYAGLAPEYVVQLRELSRAVDIPTELYVRDEFLFMASEAFPLGQFDSRRDRFCYIKDFKINPLEHVVWKFAKDLSIEFPKRPMRSGGGLRLICPDAAFPSKPMTREQVEQAKNGRCLVLGSDLHPRYERPDRVPSREDKLSYLEDASHVIGAENEYVFLAAAMGIKTTLFPTMCSDLFNKLFPS